MRRSALAQVEALLADGADVSEQEAGRTALHASAERGHEGLVGRLLRAGADVSGESAGSASGCYSVSGYRYSSFDILALQFGLDKVRSTR